MSEIDKDKLKAQVDAGQDVSEIVKSILSHGTITKNATLIYKADKPGFVTYCPGGIDPETGGCLNTGLVVPDPLGHLAATLLLHDT